MLNWITDFQNAKQAEDTAAYAYRLEAQALAAPITMEPVFEAVPDAELPDAPTTIGA